MSDQTWQDRLSNSIHGLHYSALHARDAYTRGLSEVEAATENAETADSSDIALDHYGHRYSPYSAVTGDIAKSYQALAVSLGRTWYRAAYAYAYGVASALVDIDAGHQPTLAVAARRGRPVPQLQLTGLELYRQAADTAEQQLTDSADEFAAQHWDVPARSWHDYADLVESALKLRLRMLALPGRR
ncbi:hypothetical protein [Streptomyces sp. NPDC001205]